MKLRILGNSIRWRLTQTEVRNLAKGKTISETTQFGLSSFLEYKLSPANTPDIQVNFQRGNITVQLPKDICIPWAKGTEISLRKNIHIEGEVILSVLIEKDFKCKTERVGENEDDMFPNPDC